MKNKTISNKRSKAPYPILIFLVWLITYIVCQFILEQKFEWDEAKYLACAKGIVNNFDFSSRSTTVLGLFKYGFPHHTQHYPLHSLYVAIFFKLFGSSLTVAYFSTWVSALITCLFIYFTVLMLTDNNNKKFSFFVAISFLFFPRVIYYCNSVMMEIPGCALLASSIFLIFRNILKNKLNPCLLGFLSIILFFYKSLFIGVVVGLLVLVVLTSSPKLPGLKINNNPIQCLVLFLIIFLVPYYILKKFVFLPLAPWLNFTTQQEGIAGTYADFAGGFLNHPVEFAIANLKNFFDIFVNGYFPKWPFILADEVVDGYYLIHPSWLEFGVFLLVLLCVTIFLFLFWKKLLPSQRTFILFTVTSIWAFNLIIIVMAKITLGLFPRYNLIYFPLFLVSCSVLLWVSIDYLRQFGKVAICLFVGLIVIIYIPIFNTNLKITNWKKDFMYKREFNNSTVIKKFIDASNPMFIYFDRGTYTTWDLFPVREIFMEVSSEQIRKLNLRLPKPIEYLFLKPDNYLFKENQELILRRQPIINNEYSFYGIDSENSIVVYRYQKLHLL